MSRTYGDNDPRFGRDLDRHLTTDPRERQADEPDGYYVQLTGARVVEFIGGDAGEDYVEQVNREAFDCGFDTFDECERFLNNLSYWAKGRGLVVPRGGLRTSADSIDSRQWADGSGSVVILAEAFGRK